MVSNKNQPGVPLDFPAKGSTKKPHLYSGDVEQLENTMAELLVQVDQQAEFFKSRIADLLAQVGVLHVTASDYAARDELVLQLRTANQNLVIATFHARDMAAAAAAVNTKEEEFLAMLAHELRNPLAPIAMANETLGTIEDAHPALPMLHAIIDRQVNTLTYLVDDLLDMSRVRTGKIALKRRPLLLSEIIDGAVESGRPLADSRHQQISVDLRTDLPEELQEEPLVVCGDLVRLTQALSNVLINAAKYTQEHGRITVSTSRLANTVTVLVKDNGTGIAPELQPFIFDLFTQGPRSLDRPEGGLGIGLALVRSVIEMHGGTVDVHSGGVGQGSEFRIHLPISPKQLPGCGSGQSAQIPARSCRILVVEDNADTNTLLNDHLVQEGHIMTSAHDGPSGLALAMQNAYDVIICDIGLPGLNGYELVERLRMHSLKSLPCLIAVAGYNRAEIRARAKKAGFDHFLVKPVLIDTLRNLIPSGAAL